MARQAKRPQPIHIGRHGFVFFNVYRLGTIYYIVLSPADDARFREQGANMALLDDVCDPYTGLPYGYFIDMLMASIPADAAGDSIA